MLRYNSCICQCKMCGIVVYSFDDNYTARKLLKLHKKCPVPYMLYICNWIRFLYTYLLNAVLTFLCNNSLLWYWVTSLKCRFISAQPRGSLNIDLHLPFLSLCCDSCFDVIFFKQYKVFYVFNQKKKTNKQMLDR